MAEQRAARSPAPGDPKATRGPIPELVDADEPPLRVFSGAAPIHIAKADDAKRIATWEQWQPLAERAQG